MNKLRRVNRDTIYFIGLICGIIGHVFISLYGAITYPEYNVYAAYWEGLKEFPFIGIVSLFNIIFCYRCLNKK